MLWSDNRTSQKPEIWIRGSGNHGTKRTYRTLWTLANDNKTIFYQQESDSCELIKAKKQNNNEKETKAHVLLKHRLVDQKRRNIKTKQTILSSSGPLMKPTQMNRYWRRSRAHTNCSSLCMSESENDTTLEPCDESANARHGWFTILKKCSHGTVAWELSGRTTLLSTSQWQ